MRADKRRRFMSEWTDREWAIFTMGYYQAGVELAHRSAWDALTEATRRASVAKKAAGTLRERQTSIREAILRTLSEES